MRARCPWCHELLSKAAAHVPTPELRDPERDAAVFWCVAAERHLVVRSSALDGIRGGVARVRDCFSARSLRASSRGSVAGLVVGLVLLVVVAFIVWEYVLPALTSFWASFSWLRAL